MLNGQYVPIKLAIKRVRAKITWTLIVYINYWRKFFHYFETNKGIKRQTYSAMTYKWAYEDVLPHHWRSVNWPTNLFDNKVINPPAPRDDEGPIQLNCMLSISIAIQLSSPSLHAARHFKLQLKILTNLTMASHLSAEMSLLWFLNQSEWVVQCGGMQIIGRVE